MTPKKSDSIDYELECTVCIEYQDEGTVKRLVYERPQVQLPDRRLTELNLMRLSQYQTDDASTEEARAIFSDMQDNGHVSSGGGVGPGRHCSHRGRRSGDGPVAAVYVLEVSTSPRATWVWAADRGQVEEPKAALSAARHQVSAARGGNSGGRTLDVDISVGALGGLQLLLVAGYAFRGTPHSIR